MITAKYFKFCKKMGEVAFGRLTVTANNNDNKMGVTIGILTIHGGHLWKVDNDSKEKGRQNEGCRVQGARVSDVSEIIFLSFNDLIVLAN